MLTSLIFHIMLSFWIWIKFEQQDCVRGRSAKPQSRMLFSFLRVHFRQFFNKKNCFSGVLVSHRQTIKHMLGVLTSPLNQNSKFAIIQFGQILLLMTKNRLMVTDHSKDVPEILPLNRMTKFDFPPHFLVRLMHSFPMMYNTI